MRNMIFAEGEYYHLLNRGVDKRIIFSDKDDLERFLDSMDQFNTSQLVGNFSHIPKDKRVAIQPEERLITFVAYCLNPNHFHFLVRQNKEKGIERFMHKLSMGYSKYFNAKHKRSGSLFQGSFKASHIDSNEYLLHASVYVNLNDRGHGFRHGVSEIGKSSWDEYVGKNPSDIFCDKSIVMDQFRDVNNYKEFAKSTLQDILNRKELNRELEELEWKNELFRHGVSEVAEK